MPRNRLPQLKQTIRDAKEVLEELDGFIIRLAAILFLLFAVLRLFGAH